MAAPPPPPSQHGDPHPCRLPTALPQAQGGLPGAGLSLPARAVPRPPSRAPQNFLRSQNNKTNYNLVCETLQFLDIMCGSTTGGLGLLGLYINEDNVGLVIQTLETLTEYCQGPCHENQVSCPAGRVATWVQGTVWAGERLRPPEPPAF